MVNFSHEHVQAKSVIPQLMTPENGPVSSSDFGQCASVVATMFFQKDFQHRFNFQSPEIPPLRLH